MRGPAPKTPPWMTVTAATLTVFVLVYVLARAGAARFGANGIDGPAVASASTANLENLRNSARSGQADVLKNTKDQHRVTDPNDPIANVLNAIRSVVSHDPAPAPTRQLVSSPAPGLPIAITTNALNQILQDAASSSQPSEQTGSPAPQLAGSPASPAAPTAPAVTSAFGTLWSVIWNAISPLSGQALAWIWNLLANGIASIPSALAKAGISFTLAAPPAAPASDPLKLNVNAAVGAAQP